MVSAPDRPELDSPPAPAGEGASSERVGLKSEPSRGVVVPLKDERYQVLPSFGVLHSFRAAFTGVARTVASQRNMKLHVLSALMVMIVGMALPLDLSMRVALLMAVAIVFFAEILNTGLEALVDLFIGEYHRLAMLAKDAAAAGVLVLSVAAVFIFADVIWTRWDLVTGNLDQVWRSVLFGVPLVLSEAVGLFVVRRGWLAAVRLIVSAALIAPLLWTSTDLIYSIYAVVLVGISAYSRHAFPSGTGRGAPRSVGEEPA